MQQLPVIMSLGTESAVKWSQAAWSKEPAKLFEVTDAARTGQQLTARW
jgi:hypothetical protein